MTVGNFAVEGNPFSVAPSRDGAAIFVTTNVDSVYRIELGDRRVSATQGTDGAAAQGLDVDRATGRLYVSTRAAGTVLELDPRTLAVIRRFAPGGMTQEPAVASGSRELWVANERGPVSVISLATGEVSEVNVDGATWGLAVTPDEQQVWVGLIEDGVVAVIDRASRQVVRRIATRGRPRRIRFTRAGDVAVITNEQGWVTIVR
ncbi:MAG TPA: YncE family protein [Gemmatimonadaceae bacterium]|nr:YncE family protein [Gemmatimonadaceae bacterium]